MSEIHAGYWNNRFLNNDTPWDIGQVSTPIKNYIDQLTDKHMAILIPGCGNGWEAAYLLENGFTEVTVIDIAPALTQLLAVRFQAFAGKQLHIITGDFFDLEGQFDLIIEQTFLSALAPSLRPQYAAQMHRLLKPKGKLAGLLFNKNFTDPGPPFGGDIPEYNRLLAPFFHINTMAPSYNSIAPREGAECFFIVENQTNTGGNP